MNILISCVGRQSFLVEKFRRELDTGKVLAADCDADAPGLQAADIGLPSPAFTDRLYKRWVLETCKKFDIELLLTLNVDDLLILEQMRPELQDAGCRLVGGDIEKIKLSMDKYRLYEFCVAHGLPAPHTFLSHQYDKKTNLRFPMITKPREGRGSRGIIRLSNRGELENLVEAEGTMIFQEMVEGQEYGLDIINDFEGNFVGLNVRKKMAMKNGETDRAVIESPEPWLDFGKKISRLLRHQGTVDIDVMLGQGKPYLIDVNFRFGGGYIFSELAGSNIPHAYIRWAAGKSPEADSLTANPGIEVQRNKDGRVSEQKPAV